MTNKRRTGRTTRMLREAWRMATEEDRDVVVVMATNQECRRAMFDLRGFGVGDFQDGRCVVVPNAGGRIIVRPALGREWDWDRMEFLGEHYLVLVDHYAIEQRYWRQIQMMMRFDA